MSASRQTPRNLYGRRLGRPLRPGQRSLLERSLPQLAVALPDDSSQRLGLAALFDASCDDFWLEIGFGGGEHLAWQAARHPRVGFIGAEFFVNGLASLLRHVERERLDNIRVYRGDGRDLLNVLPDESVGRCFVLFPDPWRKARHHKRRFISRETLDQLGRVMRDGAELRLATDHAHYLVWMLEHCCDHRDFRWLARGPSDWRVRPHDWPATRYEAKAIDAGRQPAYLRFVRVPRGRL